MNNRYKNIISSLIVFCLIICVSTPETGAAPLADETNVYDFYEIPKNVKNLIELEAPSTKVLKDNNLHQITTESSEGTGTVTLFGVPIKYKDEKGEINFIDTSMTGVGLLKSLFGEYDYQNKANSFKTEFSKSLEKGIKISGEDGILNMSVYNGKASEYCLSHQS